MVSKPLVTLHMIVKNEEKTLETCLRSVKEFVDEIVIVDTGSTDETVQLAKDFGARVATFEWVDDFAAARNVSLGLVRTPWALWLDADDMVLNPECIPETVEHAFKNKASSIWSYYKQDATSVQRRLQLFRTKMYQWRGFVHENPCPIREWGDGYLSDLVVLHRKPEERGPSSARYYLDILLGKDPENWMGIAESYKYIAFNPDDPAKLAHYQEMAEAYYYRAFEEPNMNDQSRYVALFMAARINLERSKTDNKWFEIALKQCQLGISYCFERAECWTLLGSCWEVLEQYHLAVNAYETALMCEVPRGDIGLYYVEYYDVLPEKLLAELKEKMNRERPQGPELILPEGRKIITPK